jgi:hypothetical protein
VFIVVTNMAARPRCNPPIHAARLPLTEASLDEARVSHGRILANAERPKATLIEALVATRRRWGASPLMLAASGGTDSALISLALLGTPFPPVVTLAVSSDSRDLLATRRLGATLGFTPQPLLVDEEKIRATIATHARFLADLPDYTQRILAVAEILLARAAAGTGAALVTGHGPEAILGGFHRRATPLIGDHDGMLGRLFLNLRRLNRVAIASDSEIRLPFLEPEVFAAIAALRRAGGDKEGVIHAVRPDLPLPPEKSSLQNGSGVHYLFARMARRAGARYVRDFMESLI